MNKVCYILHGLGADPEDNWFPWLKLELEKKGYLVIVPELPNAYFPTVSGWLTTLQTTVQENGEGIMIGHSLGGVLVAHYLLNGGHASKVILVATPFSKLKIIPTIDEFMIDFSPLKKLVKDKLQNTRFTVFQSNNDHCVPVSHGKKWARLLGAEYRLLPDYEHFTSADLPEILEYL